MSQLCLTLLHKYMNCNMKRNGEKIKIDETKICVIFECEWNSRQFSGENGDWLSELSAGENIWDRRKRSRTLRYGDCVLRADCVRVIGWRAGREGSGGIVRHLLENLDGEFEGKKI